MGSGLNNEGDVKKHYKLVVVLIGRVTELTELQPHAGRD
jgi:hypothetical protein